MSSAFRWMVFAMLSCAALSAQERELRVCADPNNLPYSNAREEGFENALARLVANELGMKVKYVWAAQRQAFFRKTLNAGLCDVVMEVPIGFDQAAATEPYYRSTYVFVTQRDRGLHLRSLDDPALKRLKIGVHVIEDEGEPPPVRAFIRRGMVSNLVGYVIFGDLGRENPPAELIQAVADGRVDVAAAWGPLAGYFSKHSKVPLQVEPICSNVPDHFAPLVFQIAMGVRRGDTALRDRLNQVIERRRPEIQRLLTSYGVPLATSEVAQKCELRS